jgi:AraC-like DNA-binding protein
MVLVGRLLEAVMPFVTRHPGTFGLETPLPRMKVWSSTRPTPPNPAMFEPMFYAVLRGTKVLTIDGNRFALNAGDCAASSFGLPYVGELAGATPALPYVAISLDLDVELLTNIMLDMPKSADQWTCPAAGSTLEGALGEAFARLVGLLAAPDDRAMLGRHYERELYYRLLQSPMGDTLRQLGQRDDRRRRIKTAADWLCSNQDKPFVVSDLAASVGMSRTSFHRHFKAVTGYSPLAFQRQMRLLEARRLLVAGDISVSRVAYAVGYVSPSQFSREYKSVFGTPPVADQGASARGGAG